MNGVIEAVLVSLAAAVERRIILGLLVEVDVQAAVIGPFEAYIFLGADPALPSEDSATFGPGPFLLHHLYGRPSEMIVFGGPWLDRARMILRHKDGRNEMFRTG